MSVADMFRRFEVAEPRSAYGRELPRAGFATDLCAVFGRTATLTLIASCGGRVLRHYAVAPASSLALLAAVAAGGVAPAPFATCDLPRERTTPFADVASRVSSHTNYCVSMRVTQKKMTLSIFFLLERC